MTSFPPPTQSRRIFQFLWAPRSNCEQVEEARKLEFQKEGHSNILKKPRPPQPSVGRRAIGYGQQSNRWKSHLSLRCDLPVFSSKLKSKTCKKKKREENIRSNLWNRWSLERAPPRRLASTLTLFRVKMAQKRQHTATLFLLRSTTQSEKSRNGSINSWNILEHFFKKNVWN